MTWVTLPNAMLAAIGSTLIALTAAYIKRSRRDAVAVKVVEASLPKLETVVAGLVESTSNMNRSIGQLERVNRVQSRNLCRIMKSIRPQIKTMRSLVYAQQEMSEGRSEAARASSAKAMEHVNEAEDEFTGATEENTAAALGMEEQG